MVCRVYLKLFGIGGLISDVENEASLIIYLRVCYYLKGVVVIACCFIFLSLTHLLLLAERRPAASPAAHPEGSLNDIRRSP